MGAKKLNVMSSKKKDVIFKQFGDHISKGQIRFLMAGHLDILEKRRQGVEFVEAKSGKSYFDCFSSAGSFNTGRCNAKVISAMCNQADHSDMGTTTLLSKPKIEFARKLSNLSPGDLNKVVFTGSGADSIEAAIKLAKGATGRDEVISMELAYHGHSGLSLSAGGKAYYKELFEPLMPGCRLVPFNNLSAIRSIASERTAAILLEPVQGEGGIHVATDEYLQGLRTLCDDLGIILIFDEIQTGFGRTGKIWFSEHSGVVPDIMCLAKSIGGGVCPNGAIVYRDTEQLVGYVNKNPFFHTSSGGGNDISCQVSSKVIDVLLERKLWQNAEKMGLRLKEGLTRIMEKNASIIKEIRGKGLMIGIEYTQEFMGVLMADCLSNSGIFAAYSGNAPQVMRFMFPLTVTETQVDEFLTRFKKAVSIQRFYLFFLLPLSKIPIVRKWLNEDDILIPVNVFLRKFGM
ncbi:MAG: aspartate aminotransferase family protein [Desulfobacterales bacterium]|nr:aspartate aminotransferase family protein [Desulfobacterales bacterium]